MEEREWEIRRREWDAWRATENDKWERQKRKVANRRERDDVMRGHWEITEPLTTDEKYKLRNLNDFDRWKKVTTDGNKEWKLKDPKTNRGTTSSPTKYQAYKGSANFCRNPTTS